MSYAALLHFGSGALGLGLTVPVIASSAHKLDIYLVNRKHSSDLSSTSKNERLRENKYYYVRRSGLDDPVRIKGLYYLQEEKDKILSILNQDIPIILTTALKESGIKNVIPQLSEFIDYRNSRNFESPLLLIACENALTSNDVLKSILNHLRQLNDGVYDLSENIFSADCVVDRICTTPVINNVNVIVNAEEYCSWIIDRKPILNHSTSKANAKLFEIFSTCRNVEFVDDIYFFTRRKKWLVNSTHQLIALYAHLYSHANVNVFLKTEKGREILGRLLYEIMTVYLVNEETANLADTKAYVDQIETRLIESYSTVYSALSRFNPSQIEDFLTDFHRKVAHPVIEYMAKTREPLFWIPFIFFKVAEMVSNKKYVTNRE